MKKILINLRDNWIKYGFETLVVTVGILGAFALDNWNEGRIESALEEDYLIGIRQDLIADMDQVKTIIEFYIPPLNIIHMLEPGFEKASSVLDIETTIKHDFDSLYSLSTIDTISFDFFRLFHRGRSFRPKKAAYNSLITDGKSHLLKNKVLSQKIQNLYDESDPRISSLYETIKERETILSSTYSYEKFHWNYSTIMNSGNKKITADLASFWEKTLYYCQFMEASVIEMKTIIKEIDIELEK